MFSFFSKNSVLKWETELMLRIVGRVLPDRVDLSEQLRAGLLAKRFPNSTDQFPNKIGFWFDPKVSRKYEKPMEGDFCIQGVRVFDRKTNAQIEVWVLVYRGLVSGYCTPGYSDFDLDLREIDTAHAMIRFLRRVGFEKIRSILDEESLALINPSEVFEVVFDGKNYYQVRDLGNGDFLGIDEQGNGFRFLHDPFGITRLGSSIAEILRDGDNW